jgi:hypothetical protein
MIQLRWINPHWIKHLKFFPALPVWFKCARYSFPQNGKTRLGHPARLTNSEVARLTLALYSVESAIKPQPWITVNRLFVVFPSLSRHLLGYLKLGRDRFLYHTFQFIRLSHHSALLYELLAVSLEDANDKALHSLVPCG